jgi:hypothetical protein
VLVFTKVVHVFFILFSIFSISCKQNTDPSVEGSSLNNACDSISYSSEFLGEYKICRPERSETRLKIELKNPNIERKYCFIPNYFNPSTKKAIYIGEPRCVFVKSPDKPVELTLLKNRNSQQGSDDYSNFPINSVMILIDEVHSFPPPYEYPMSSVEAYLKCYEFIDSLEDSAYCQAFKEMKLYTFHSFSS